MSKTWSRRMRNPDPRGTRTGNGVCSGNRRHLCSTEPRELLRKFHRMWDSEAGVDPFSNGIIIEKLREKFRDLQTQLGDCMPERWVSKMDRWVSKNEASRSLKRHRFKFWVLILLKFSKKLSWAIVPKNEWQNCFFPLWGEDSFFDPILWWPYTYLKVIKLIHVCERFLKVPKTKK